MKVVMVALLPLVLVLLVPTATASRCPAVSSSPSPYQCWNNFDHAPNTLQVINCNTRRAAATMKGCLDICTPLANCYGTVFIPNPYEWLNGGKNCCILKTRGMRCSTVLYKDNRITCRWVGTGPVGDLIDESGLPTKRA